MSPSLDNFSLSKSNPIQTSPFIRRSVVLDVQINYLIIICACAYFSSFYSNEQTIYCFVKSKSIAYFHLELTLQAQQMNHILIILLLFILDPASGAGFLMTIKNGMLIAQVKGNITTWTCSVPHSVSIDTWNNYAFRWYSTNGNIDVSFGV